MTTRRDDGADQPRCGHGLPLTHAHWNGYGPNHVGEWEPCDRPPEPAAPPPAPTEQPCLERGPHDPHRYGRLDAGDDDRGAGVVNYWCPGSPPAPTDVIGDVLPSSVRTYIAHPAPTEAQRVLDEHYANNPYPALPIPTEDVATLVEPLLAYAKWIGVTADHVLYRAAGALECLAADLAAARAAQRYVEAARDEAIARADLAESHLDGQAWEDLTRGLREQPEKIARLLEDTAQADLDRGGVDPMLDTHVLGIRRAADLARQFAALDSAGQTERPATLMPGEPT